MAMTATVLLVEDERKLRELVRSYLERAGLAVLSTGSGAEALTLAAEAAPDLVVLDLGLPDVPGEVIARELRAAGSVPILMLTAKAGEEDRIAGLELGADDYVTKPFSPRELVARIKAVLRRAAKVAPDGDDLPLAYEFNGWRLEPAGRILRSPSGAVVDITSGEFDLLMAFVARPQRVLTRDQLLDLAKGRSSAAFDRSIDVQISRLRRKIEADPREPAIIKTIRSGGYLFTSLVQAIRPTA